MAAGGESTVASGTSTSSSTSSSYPHPVRDSTRGPQFLILQRSGSMMMPLNLMSTFLMQLPLHPCILRPRQKPLGLARILLSFFPPTQPRLLPTCVHVTHQTGQTPSRISPPTISTIFLATVVSTTTNTSNAALRMPSLSRGVNPACLLASFQPPQMGPRQSPCSHQPRPRQGPPGHSFW